MIKIWCKSLKKKNGDVWNDNSKKNEYKWDSWIE